MSTPHPDFTILHVEDEYIDVELLAEAIGRCEPTTEIRVVGTVDEGLAYLREHGVDSPPDLVLLDLNLPGRPGTELLAEVKQNPRLKSIPVIVLSSTKAAPEVRRCYELNANAFLRKSGGFTEYCEMATSLVDFWFRRAERATVN